MHHRVHARQVEVLFIQYSFLKNEMNCPRETIGKLKEGVIGTENKEIWRQLTEKKVVK